MSSITERYDVYIPLFILIVVRSLGVLFRQCDSVSAMKCLPHFWWCDIEYAFILHAGEWVIFRAVVIQHLIVKHIIVILQYLLQKSVSESANNYDSSTCYSKQHRTPIFLLPCFVYYSHAMFPAYSHKNVIFIARIFRHSSVHSPAATTVTASTCCSVHCSGATCRYACEVGVCVSGVKAA